MTSGSIFRKTGRPLPARAFRWTAALLMVAALGACGERAQKTAALEPKDDTACVLDGMILKDYAGPKAQIHYSEGQPDFFCDLMELFGAVLTPEQKRAVAAIYVQDMGKADWEHPQGHWIDAKKAVYVAGSGKRGSMGPTFGSFSSEQDAEAFARKEGGRVLRFDQITADMLGRGGAHHGGMPH